MKSERLLGAVGGIRDEYIQEANETPEKKTKTYGWIKWVAAAACLVVVALIAAPIIKTAVTPVGSKYAYQEVHTYNSYEELAAEYVDPVFEAFSRSEVTQKYDVVYQTLWGADPKGDLSNVTEWSDPYLAEICATFDSAGLPDSVLSDDAGYLVSDTQVLIRCYSEAAESWDELSIKAFQQAEEYGVRIDYEVNGIEVQKFDVMASGAAMLEREVPEFEMPSARYESHVYFERVSINDVWYYVESKDEATADSVATALAQIAKQL